METNQVKATIYRLRKRFNKLGAAKGIIVKRNFPIEINFWWDSGPKGFADLNWGERELWKRLEKHIDEVAGLYNKKVKRLIDDADKYANKFGIPSDIFWEYIMGAEITLAS